MADQVTQANFPPRNSPVQLKKKTLFSTILVLFLIVFGAVLFSWKTHPSPQTSSQLLLAVVPSVVPSASPSVNSTDILASSTPTPDCSACSVVLNFQPLGESTATG